MQLVSFLFCVITDVYAIRNVQPVKCHCCRWKGTEKMQYDIFTDARQLMPTFSALPLERDLWRASRWVRALDVAPELRRISPPLVIER